MKSTYKILIKDKDGNYRLSNVDGYIYNLFGIRRYDNEKQWTATILSNGQVISKGSTLRECKRKASENYGRIKEIAPDIITRADTLYNKLIKEIK